MPHFSKLLFFQSCLSLVVKSLILSEDLLLAFVTNLEDPETKKNQVVKEFHMPGSYGPRSLRWGGGGGGGGGGHISVSLSPAHLYLHLGLLRDTVSFFLRYTFCPYSHGQYVRIKISGAWYFQR